MVFIPGWILTIRKNELLRYSIRLKYKQSIDSLKYYILKGEHTCKIPFSIYKNNNSLGIIINKQDNNKKECFLIGSNVISINDINNSPWTLVEDLGLELFLKNYVEYLITSYRPEYTPSNLVKTYLGQYAKGRISNRENPIDSLEFDFPYIVKFNLCEAEEFGVMKLGDNNKYLITYFPRFEIFDDILHLPQNQYTQVFEKWRDVMAKMDIKQRFDKINTILKNASESQTLIEFINNKIPKFEAQVCEYPEFALSPNYKKKLGLVPFSELYLNEIKMKIEKKKKIGLTIAIDLMAHKEIDDKILDFLNKIQKYFKLMNLIFIVKDKKNSFISDQIDKMNGILKCKKDCIYYSEMEIINKSENVLFLIDNTVSGFDYLYSQFKQKVKKPNKVIQFRTIIEENHTILTYGLLYLSFIFRKENNNILIMKEKNKPLIAFNIQKDFDYQYIFLMASYINSNGKFLTKKYMIPAIDIFEKTPNIDNEIVEFIEESLRQISIDFPDHKVIILCKNSWDLKDYINLALQRIKLYKKFFLIILKDFPIKMFNNVPLQEIPENGTYLHFRREDSEIFILLTNGGVDKPENGTPNPITFEVFNDSGSEKSELVQTVFDHSFYHPTSFNKSNLPIEYHLLLEMTKLPLKLKYENKDVIIL